MRRRQVAHVTARGSRPEVPLSILHLWLNAYVTPRSALRSVVYAVEKRAQLFRFGSLNMPEGDWPTLLGISFPKSGTHLLDQILLGFAGAAPFGRRLHSFYAEYEGETGVKRPAEEALAWLDSLRPLDVASAHLFARPEVVDRVCKAAFVPYFIFRDPRDVVVSHVYYVTDMETRHVHHRYYAALPDFDARLTASILGRPSMAIEFPDVAARFAPYLGWLERSEVLKLQFEDLVDDRARMLGMIVDHFLKRVPLAGARSRMLDSVGASIDPGRSPTFRAGKTGEWRTHFTPAHKSMFKEVAGELLVKLGYEDGDNW
jgi:hypothetical protein